MGNLIFQFLSETDDPEWEEGDNDIAETGVVLVVVVTTVVVIVVVTSAVVVVVEGPTVVVMLVVDPGIVTVFS